MPVLYQDEDITVYQQEVWSDGVLNKASILVLPNQPGVTLGQTEGDLLVDVQLTDMETTYSLDSFVQTKLRDQGVTPNTPFADWPEELLFIQSCQRTENGGLRFDLMDYFLVSNSDKDILLCAVVQVRSPGSEEVSGHTARLKFRRSSRKLEVPSTYSRWSLGNFHFELSESGADLDPQSCFLYITDHYAHHALTYAADEPVEMYTERSDRGPVHMLYSNRLPHTRPGLYVNWMTLDLADITGYETLYITVAGDDPLPTATPVLLPTPTPAADVSGLTLLHEDEQVRVYLAQSWYDSILLDCQLLVTPADPADVLCLPGETDGTLAADLRGFFLSGKEQPETWVKRNKLADAFQAGQPLTQWEAPFDLFPTAERTPQGGLLFDAKTYFVVHDGTQQNVGFLLHTADPKGDAAQTDAFIAPIAVQSRQIQSPLRLLLPTAPYTYPAIMSNSSVRFTDLALQFCIQFRLAEDADPVSLRAVALNGEPVTMHWSMLDDSGSLYKWWGTLLDTDISKSDMIRFEVYDLATGETLKTFECQFTSERLSIH